MLKLNVVCQNLMKSASKEKNQHENLLTNIVLVMYSVIALDGRPKSTFGSTDQKYFWFVQKYFWF